MEGIIDYKTLEIQNSPSLFNPERVTNLQINIDGIDENPFYNNPVWWKTKSNGQTIDAKGDIEWAELDCSTNSISGQLPVIPSPETTPTWGQWEEWGYCSGSCGYETRSRFRKCLDGTDNSCVGEETFHERCQITCEETQVINEITSQTGESLDLSNQAALNCKVFHHETVFTFHNGIAKCSNIGPNWKYPPSSFYDDVSIEEFWIGARLNDNKWVNDQNEEIPEPIYDLAGSKILLAMSDSFMTADGAPVPLDPEICLYRKNGNTLSGLCIEAKPVVCCEGLTIALNQGKDYRISYLGYQENI